MIDALLKDNHALIYNVEHLSIEVGQELSLNIPGQYTVFSSHDPVLEIKERKREINIKALEPGNSELQISFCTGPLGMAKHSRCIKIDVKEDLIESLILVAEKPVLEI